MDNTDQQNFKKISFMKIDVFYPKITIKTLMLMQQQKHAYSESHSSSFLAVRHVQLILSKSPTIIS